MSWHASSHVLGLAERTGRADLSPTELLVLLALAARHNDRDYHCAYGQLQRMARDTHLHPVTLSETLSGLEDKGIITIWEGQLPARKDDPADARRTRGTMWCFVGLDSDDGPNIVGAERRVRTGGRPRGTTELVTGELSFETQLAQGGRSVSRNGVDGLVDSEQKGQTELVDSNSPLLTGERSLTGERTGNNRIPPAPKGAPPAVNGSVQASHKPPGNARVAEVIDAFRERLADSSVREPVFTGRDYAAIKMSTAPPELIVEVYEAVAVCEYGDQFMRKRLSVHEAIEWINGYVEWKAEQAWRNNGTT